MWFIKDCRDGGPCELLVHLKLGVGGGWREWGGYTSQQTEGEWERCPNMTHSRPAMVWE